MSPHTPDPVVRFLTAAVIFAYYLFWTVPVVMLVSAVEMSGLVGDQRLIYSPVEIDVEVEVPGPEYVATEWGAATLDDPRADLNLELRRLPWDIASLPIGFGILTAGIYLLILHHLRRIFERVRDGAPFDAQNAVRLRWIGLLLIPLMLAQQLEPYLTSQAFTSQDPDPVLGVNIISRFDLDLTKLFVALTVIALAEVFRRGADLEDEQSLVV